MPKVAILGSTGPLGIQLLSQLLSQNHQVSALVRNKQKLEQMSSKDLTITIGDVKSLSTIKEFLSIFPDFIIITLGGSDDVCSTATKHVLEWLESNVDAKTRLIVVTSMGCGDSKDDVPFVFKIVKYCFLGKVFIDKELQEGSIFNSKFKNWIIVRPGGLTNKLGVGKWRVADRIPSGGMISRSDVAGFIIKCFEGDEWVGKSPSIVY